MENAVASRPTYLNVKDAGSCLRESVDKGCALWLVREPFCHKMALARLYEHEQGAHITELFRETFLEPARDVLPRVAIRPELSMRFGQFS